MILGAAVVVMWLMILFRQTVGEGNTEMTFHLVSEFVMASICLGSGICLFRGKCLLRGEWLTRGTHPVNGLRRAILANLVGHSMVVYSVLNAAGYYAERGEGSMVLVFLVLLMLSAAMLAIHFSISLPGLPGVTTD